MPRVRTRPSERSDGRREALLLGRSAGTRLPRMRSVTLQRALIAVSILLVSGTLSAQHSPAPSGGRPRAREWSALLLRRASLPESIPPRRRRDRGSRRDRRARRRPRDRVRSCPATSGPPRSRRRRGRRIGRPLRRLRGGAGPRQERRPVLPGPLRLPNPPLRSRGRWGSLRCAPHPGDVPRLLISSQPGGPP